MHARVRGRVVVRGVQLLAGLALVPAIGLVLGLATTPHGPLPAGAQDLGRSSSGPGSGVLRDASAGTWLALSVHLDDAHLVDRTWDHDRLQLSRALRAGHLPGSGLLFPAHTYDSSAVPGASTARDPAASAPGLQQMEDAKATAATAARDLLTGLGLPAGPDLSFATGDVQGPSAGLVMALARLDAAVGGHLTGGRVVAATGELGADGGVSPIGGVAAKIELAVAAGADVALVPADNADEAAAALRRAPGTSAVRVGAVPSLRAAVLELCAPLPAAPELCTRAAAQASAEQEQARLVTLAHGVE